MQTEAMNQLISYTYKQSDFFLHQRRRPLLAITKKAGFEHFGIGFTFQTLKLCPFYTRVGF